MGIHELPILVPSSNQALPVEAGMSAASALLQRVAGPGARRMGGRDPQLQFTYDAAIPEPSLVAADPIAQL